MRWPSGPAAALRSRTAWMRRMAASPRLTIAIREIIEQVSFVVPTPGGQVALVTPYPQPSTPRWRPASRRGCDCAGAWRKAGGRGARPRFESLGPDRPRVDIALGWRGEV